MMTLHKTSLHEKPSRPLAQLATKMPVFYVSMFKYHELQASFH